MNVELRRKGENEEKMIKRIFMLKTEFTSHFLNTYSLLG